MKARRHTRSGSAVGENAEGTNLGRLPSDLVFVNESCAFIKQKADFLRNLLRLAKRNCPPDLPRYFNEIFHDLLTAEGSRGTTQMTRRKKTSCQSRQGVG